MADLPPRSADELCDFWTIVYSLKEVGTAKCAIEVGTICPLAIAAAFINSWLEDSAEHITTGEKKVLFETRN
ncbi:MAG: hypothetical protein U1F40_00655 [Turneriella sp.]